MRRVLIAISRAFAPVALPIAARGWLPFWAVLRHRGRRSGRTFTTALAVARTPDGFMIPLPFGDATDWCRNVRAAGRCVLRWRGAEIAVEDPEVVELGVALPAFPVVEQILIRAMGIRRFLSVRDTADRSSVSAPAAAAARR